MIMRQFTKCEKCEHNKICMYKKSAKEILDKTEKYLDTNYVYIPSIFEFSFEYKTEKYLDTNYVYIPSIFEFSFECKEFKQTPLQK